MVAVRVDRRGSAAHRLDEIARNLEGPSKVRVGYPAGETDSEVLAIATYNEFGTSRGIPERPAGRNALRANRSSYQDMARQGAASIIRGEADSRQVLTRMGLKAQGDWQKEIQTLASPPNAPSTIQRKGSSNPLIDTGRMRQAVTFKVED